MNKIALAILSGTVLAASAPAAAAPFITTTATGSGSFGDNSLTCIGQPAPCAFSDTLTFITPAGFNLASATLSSSMVGTDATTNVDFTTVTLNGINFSSILTGYTEFRTLLSQAVVAGATNTLVISGTTGGNGSFGGSLVFAATTVPEAATWTMMILGLGLVGYMIRGRQKTVARIVYA